MSEPLTYARMAEQHWRTHCPRRVRELERTGRLQAELLEAQEQTTSEMFRLTRDLLANGRTADQAHREAWEQVRERYILIPPETA